MRKVRKMILLTFLLALILVNFLPSYAQLESVEAKMGWVQALGVTWVFLLILAGVLIVAGKFIGGRNWKIGKSLMQVGLIIIYVSIFGVEIVYLLPYLGKPIVEYEECKGWSFAGFPSIPFAFACVFTGYAPAGAEALTFASFFIFGILVPLGLLIALFYNFSDFIANPNVRIIIAILSGMLSFRFLMATLFTELLSYGFAGIGLLFLDYLFFMWVQKSVGGLFRGAAVVETVLSMAVTDEIAHLNRVIEEKRMLLDKTPKDSPTYKALERDIKDLMERLEKLKAEAVKYGVEKRAG
jgi:hypothetical protein